MSSLQQRSALSALYEARPSISRLDVARHPDENAADLIEAWEGTQHALQALASAPTLLGQAVIRELRGRQLLTLDQAHALVEFNAAADRARNTDYQPTTVDIASAQSGFQQLEAMLMHGDIPSLDAAAASHSEARSAPIETPATEPAPEIYSPLPSARITRTRVNIGAIVFVLVLLGAAVPAVWFLLRGKTDQRLMDRAVQAYARGERGNARAAFIDLTRRSPELALPHVYLGRLAREDGDAATASQELEKAIRLDPKNAIAQREMGAHLLALGNLELAKKFYVRAIELDPNDRNAQGFLGCTLIRMGNVALGMNFISRAGQGSWTSCVPVVPPPQPPPLNR